MKSWGDGRYVTKRSFDVYEGAANNNNGVAGAFAAGGIGAGVGMNVAQAAGGIAPRINPGQMVICPKCGGKICTGKQVLQYLRSKAGGGEKTLSQLRKRK